MEPDPSYIKLLWGFHAELNIRWVGFLDRVGHSFKDSWLEDATNLFEKEEEHAYWVVLPSSILHSVTKSDLHKLELNAVVEDSLQLQPNVYRVILLDKEYMTGIQILWINAPPVLEAPKDNSERFDRILSDSIENL